MAVKGNRITYQWTEGDTIGRAFRRTAELHWNDNKIAVKQKNLGIWDVFTWKQHYQDAKHAALGLVKLGAKPGDKIFIMGSPRQESFALAYGCVSIGMTLVPTFPVTRRDEILYIINHSDSKFLVVEGQEQADKILELKAESPNEFAQAVKMVYWEPKGMWNYKDQFFLSFEELLILGEELDKEQPKLFDELLEKVTPDFTTMLQYTSGTTGNPKGAIWTNRGLLQIIQSWMNIMPMYPDDQCFSLIVLDVSINSLPHVLSGARMNIPEAQETTARDLREVGWTIGWVIGLEQQASEMQVRIGDATFLKRLTWQLFRPVGFKKAEAMVKDERLSPFWSFIYSIGYGLIFRPILDKHGMLKARNAYVGAVATSPDVLKLFSGIGVQIRNLYGQNECMPISCTTAGSGDADSVGPPAPDREVRISSEGEIWARGPSAEGYYKNPEATAKFKDDKLWVHTGDAGFVMPDGRLVVIDRLAHLMRMRDGTEFSPLFIENKLKFSPYIRQAIITGQDKDCVCALISIDNNFVTQWAEKCQIPYTSSADLSQRQEVYKLIRKDIEQRVNNTLPAKTRVKKFALLPKEMDIDDGELTRTFKLRRGFVADRYYNFIEALYTDASDHILDVESTYEDGRKARVRVPCKIATVETGEQGCNFSNLPSFH